MLKSNVQTGNMETCKRTTRGRSGLSVWKQWQLVRGGGSPCKMVVQLVQKVPMQKNNKFNEEWWEKNPLTYEDWELSENVRCAMDTDKLKKINFG